MFDPTEILRMPTKPIGIVGIGSALIWQIMVIPQFSGISKVLCYNAPQTLQICLYGVRRVWVV